MKISDNIEIAVIGKCVGLRGELKLHLRSDFPEQFKKGNTFYINEHEVLKIEYYNSKRDLVKFENYDNREDAQKLINKILYTTTEDTKKNCSLKKGEFFWFDMIGSSVKDDDKCLGIVSEIERIGTVDYLIVETDQSLLENTKFPKKFYIPYIEQYVKKFDIEAKEVLTNSAYEILKSS